MSLSGNTAPPAVNASATAAATNQRIHLPNVAILHQIGVDASSSQNAAFRRPQEESIRYAILKARTGRLSKS